MSLSRATVRGLLDAAKRGDLLDYCNGLRPLIGRASEAENKLAKLADRGLVAWNGPLSEAVITPKGEAYLERLAARKGSVKP